MAEREEESLLDEMREAIRAQRERAAARAERPREAPAPTGEPPRKPLLRRLIGR